MSSLKDRKWPRWLLLPVAALTFPVMVFIGLPLMGVAALISIPVGKRTVRRLAQQHAGEVVFIHFAVASQAKSGEVAWRRFLKQAVEPALPPEIRVIDGCEQIRPEQVELLKAGISRDRAPTTNCDLYLIDPAGSVRQGIEPELRQLYAQWQAGADVTARIAQLFERTIQELQQSSGAAHVDAPSPGRAAK